MCSESTRLEGFRRKRCVRFVAEELNAPKNGFDTTRLFTKPIYSRILTTFHLLLSCIACLNINTRIQRMHEFSLFSRVCEDTIIPALIKVPINYSDIISQTKVLHSYSYQMNTNQLAIDFPMRRNNLSGLWKKLASNEVAQSLSIAF